ncbi:hypothetical protein [Prochlorococcus sp. MIT 1223]|uniref:hypothetical protein n=1 Tax=Prochlorococcus sp. MIT 1223 TaxID=3096217 RepID=UPI002A7488F8|nr:hypothetical protein [Prochlorococcus sp. MIT 1223]
MSSMPENNPVSDHDPLQRKTTLKWGADGELSAIDMARIIAKLDNTSLTECDL